ncbi:MAG: DUF3798 domain-containing protein [Defluviitaleaceae bacterium]|nr:DUF3798 domain-containing protein [Defluviitaleaceae bacterium]
MHKKRLWKLQAKSLVAVVIITIMFSITPVWANTSNGMSNEADVNNDWKIGIMTDHAWGWGHEYQAAARMQEQFGSDRIIKNPHSFAYWNVTEIIANTLALAEAGAQAIIFAPTLPFTMEAIQATREILGDDILFFAVMSSMYPYPVEYLFYADVMLTHDHAMGRPIVEQAYRMGADTFAHISFPRHLNMRGIAYRREQMMETAAELGIKWVDITALDSMNVGLLDARSFTYENAPLWIKELGQNTAFFATPCAIQSSLVAQIISYGGFSPSQCCPIPFHVFPDVFNISMEGHEGDENFLVYRIREEVNARGAVGRISIRPVAVDTLAVEVGVLYAIEYINGNTNGRNDNDVLRQIVDEVAASYGITAKLSNRRLEGGTIVENFYAVLLGFVDF